MNPTLETKELAQGVYDYLSQHPEKHEQATFIGKYDERTTEPFDYDGRVDEVNFCNTTLCVAGAAVFLAEGIEGLNYHIENGEWEEKAEALLGLENSEGPMLFYTMDEATALNMLKAVAQGDEEKFNELYYNSDDEE